jgi:hypothetical protein
MLEQGNPEDPIGLTFVRLSVILRGDLILDEQGRALDGNNIAPGTPLRPSGNGTEGGDWISVINLMKDVK